MTLKQPIALLALTWLPWQLTVLGTPAEEGGGGKVKMIRLEAFKDIDVALMAHPTPFDETRPSVLACME